jgi:hypothetical protein
LPIYEKVVHYKPPYHAFRAGDGAPIDRLWFEYRQANRKHWLPKRKLTLDPTILQMITKIFDWAKSKPSVTKLGIISYVLVELAIEVALKPDDAAVRERWLKAGQSKAELDKAISVLGPIVKSWPGEIVLGHYGAIRGLNSMADVDCLATLGDPWPNIGNTRNDAAFIGLDDTEQLSVDKCRAELEQAHGRLRPIHRSKPGYALHIGSVRPGGTGWQTCTREECVGGRPKNESGMTVKEVREIVEQVGSARKLAEVLGCNPSTISRYLKGWYPVSNKNAKLIRAICRPVKGHSGTC